MRKILSIFMLLVCTIAFSQKTISGVVKNSEGETVSSASITIEEKGKDAILAYAITNAKGEYKVTFTSPESSVEVKVKAFNHKTLIKSINNDTHTENFALSPEATEIKEVKLKAKMISSKGDTISYDLKAFENKSDRTLSDVLKKMPGIEVNKDGSVVYLGKPLGKYTVNGKDLMEGGYGTINNSLPKDAVSKVEILENHQPIKILQGKIPSDQATMNIKLKAKVTMTGRGEVSTGFIDPWLWNLKLTPMFFG
ncbi:MAG: carboxypeptidase regulatory-like domain-containing protein, partial [Bacteroidetes bacterium]|nr:carboxypeptidase regulatory-like domain-containing protein [Bacteroidota bacterium]